MTELGKLLKEKREEKGMTLEELQTATKIQKRYLAAIEEGKYEVLPGAFYARAFIKNYCEAVGLHYETIFDEYSHEIPKSAKEPATEFEPRSKRDRTGAGIAEDNSLFKRLIPILLACVLIVFVLFIVWKFLLPDGNDQAKSGNEAPGVLVDEDEDKPKKKEEPKKEDMKNEAKEEPKKEEPKKQTLTKLETNGKVTTYELSDTDQLVVELTATGPSYIGIQDETKKSYFNNQLKKDQTETFDLSSAKEATLNIGASHVTSIKINGEAFTYPVPPSDLVHQKIVIKKGQ